MIDTLLLNSLWLTIVARTIITTTTGSQQPFHKLRPATKRYSQMQPHR